MLNIAATEKFYPSTQLTVTVWITSAIPAAVTVTVRVAFSAPGTSTDRVLLASTVTDASNAAHPTRPAAVWEVVDRTVSAGRR